MEAFEQGSELIEILEADDILFAELGGRIGSLAIHAAMMPKHHRGRNTVQMYLLGANTVPNTIGLRPISRGRFQAFHGIARMLLAGAALR